MEYNIENAIEHFKKYVEKFDFENDMIYMKFHHTFRVVDYAKEIAKSENLNEHDYYLATVCALLHDIGRFPQVQIYKTLNDFESIDHGNLGYDILIENDYISNYVDNEEDKLIVLKAVKNHNKYAIDDSLNEREKFFAKLTRDADKLDILDKHLNDITDNIYTIDEDSIESLTNMKLYKRDGSMKNDATAITYRLCFIFDMNFKRSFEILIEKKIIERKIMALKKCCDSKLINKFESIINDYINKALSY